MAGAFVRRDWRMVVLMTALCPGLMVAGCGGEQARQQAPGTLAEDRPAPRGAGQGPAMPGAAQGMTAAAPAEADLAATPEEEAEAAARLEVWLAAFEVPPAWLGEVSSDWDVANTPWKEGRLEIRRLLGLNTEEGRREGIKLTWDYLQKDDIGDGHEYGMYMFLGKEPIWAIKAFRERLQQEDFEYPPYFALNSLASLYTRYGLYSEAEKLLEKGLGMRPPDPAWNEFREAEFNDALGDLYLAWGKRALATEHYKEAIRLYPLAKPPYGQHLLPQRVARIQSKLDLMASDSLDSATLVDGVYQTTALGYTDDIHLTVTVADGKLGDIAVEHQEKIDQNACVIIPKRILAAQRLHVDGVSGATVTKDAILDGTLRALRQAGLQ